MRRFCWFTVFVTNRFTTIFLFLILPFFLPDSYSSLYSLFLFILFHRSFLFSATKEFHGDYSILVLNQYYPCILGGVSKAASKQLLGWDGNLQCTVAASHSPHLDTLKQTPFYSDQRLPLTQTVIPFYFHFHFRLVIHFYSGCFSKAPFFPASILLPKSTGLFSLCVWLLYRVFWGVFLLFFVVLLLEFFFGG